MNRKKVILSIFLMVALVLVGIVLPTIRKMEKSDAKKSSVSDQTDSQETESDEPIETQAETISEPDYLGFDALTVFLSDGQIADLKEQFLSYFKETELSGIDTVEFLPDETSYPDSDSTLLQFALSNGDTLPVTYSTSSGAFFFGEEKLQVSNETRTYSRQKEDTLPTLTTEEIEARQEGGYADTKDDDLTESEDASGISQAETKPDHAVTAPEADTKEVQP